MPSTHTADFQTAALKATDLEAVEKINVGLETELARKQLNIIADAPEIRIQDKTGSASETTMSIVADGGATHFRAGIDTFAEGTETKGNVKFQSSTGATTHAEIVGSSGKLELQDGGLGLKLGSNVSVTGTSSVIQEITGPHARDVVPLRKYPEIVFTEGQFDRNDTTNTYTQGGYTASTSDQNNSTTNAAYGAFDGVYDNYENRWRTDDRYVNNVSTATPSALNPSSPQTQLDTNTSIGEYLIIKLPSKIKLKNIVVNGPHMHMPYEVDIYGRNDVSTWTHVKNYVYAVPTGTSYVWNTTNQTIDATEYYLEYAFVVVKTNGHAGASIGELELYGTEETSDPDTSVDTKITSQFNLPDTTGVKLYIDGDKGSTPTDFSGEGHTLTDNSESFSGNAWSFTSLSTSNVVSDDLGFEGDHPHAVSMWFNAANVSSNATLFHVGTAAGEGDAKTTISLTESGHLGWIDGGDNQFLSANTWHNLVYATQGGGGVRTCYLDGRKLGDAQVQDTFGDYPPFAMSGYSQGGYTASSSLDIGNGEAWEAFDDIEGNYHNAWQGDGTTYSTTTRLHTGGETTTVSGTPYDGDWIQMEFPHKMYLSYIGILPMVTYGVERMPGIAIFAGSNDATTWALIRSITKNDHTAGNYSNYILNSDTCYKYIRIIWNELTTAGSTDSYRNRAAAQEIKFYGHKENDTTRFPVSSTVLKYPHIAMTGQGGTSQNVSDLQHAQRGYEVTASSMYVDNASNPYQPWRMFDDIGSSSWWASTGQANTYGGGSGAYGTVRSANLGSDSGGSATPENGEWVKIKLQHAIVLSHIVMVGTTDTSALPKSFKLYGSNNGTSWTEILAVTGASSLDTSTGTTFTPSSTPSAYKHFGLVITQTQSRTNYTVVGELKLYGTEEDLDVVARVGEGLDGKVANFRVYDKYLHEEQALELWDAQKDQFGRAESSVVVHKGRLGVGTTEPEGRFAVLDEAGEMGEFPPKPMMAAETYMEGHGNFKACASSYYGTNPSLYQPYAGFKRSADPTTQWNINTWNSISPSYSAATKQVTSGASLGGYAGEWLKLSLPYGVKLGGYQIMIRSDWADYGPEDWVIVGSNDDTTWHLIASVTAGGIGSSSGDFAMTKDFVVETTKYYKHLALVCSAIHGGVTQVNFTGLCYFGTRERGQSTLHDGSLTLTKNLTVPRIGPALDADDTPRRDRLVVEYNTSTNPTANGTVKDTSGRGNDGLFYGGASYDATEKAITLSDGTDDYVESGKTIIARGTPQHTFSFWLKPSTGDHDDTVTHYLVVWGSETSQNKWSGVGLTNDGALSHVYHASGKFTTDKVLSSPGVWYHVAVVVNSTSATTAANRDLDFYINGKSYTGTYNTFGSNNANSAYYLDWGSGTYTSVRLGSIHNSNEDSSSSLSTIKIYDVALTADEVKRLYDMGRCDEGHHVVNFSKTRVGIGLGDGEVSDALLNVGGVPYGRGAKPCFCASRRAGNVSSGNTIIFDHVEVNQQNGYNSTTGTFTAPVSGLYLFSFYGMSADTGNSFGIRAYKNGDTYEMFWPYTHHHAGSPHKHVSGTQIVPMNTGDTFLFKVQAATLYGGSNGHNSFVGYLIE